MDIVKPVANEMSPVGETPRSRLVPRLNPMRRRTVLATMGAGAASLSAVLAACGEQPAVKPPAPLANVRVFTRTEYDTPAWEVFNQSASDVRVVTETGPDVTRDYGLKLLAMAAAGASPDVMYTHPNFFSTLASTRLLADVTKLAAKSKFDLRGIQQELLDSNRWDGVLYSLPYSGVANLIVYNAGQFQKRGIPLPPERVKSGTWTWDTFRESLNKLTVRVPDLPPEVGMPEAFRGLVYMSQWVYGAGGEVWSKDLKKCLLDSKEAMSGLDFLAQLHYKDRVSIQPEEAGQFPGGLQEGFPSGRVGMRFRATTELHFYKQMAEEGAKLGVAPVPKGPAGVTPRGAANSWGVWSDTRVPDAAWKAAAGWHGDAVLKFVYAGRNCFPCRQSQFDHPAFKAALFPWEDLEVERAALRDVRIMATPGRFTEIDLIWTRLWVNARDGRKTIKDLLAEFLPEASGLLT